MLRQEGQLAAEAAKGEHAALQVNGAGMAPADSKELRVPGLLCEVSHVADLCSRLDLALECSASKGSSLCRLPTVGHTALQVDGAGMAPVDSKDRMLP